ncbi:MAG TPA: response regulator [Candidatus Limnocylindria bacterium]|nr:response regulator [Candidatus Limnocylindria bacterium]
MKRRILFVDDEPALLRLYQAIFQREREEWQMDFVETGAQALQLLQSNHYDAIVSDMRMPQINGAQLLHQVSHSHPRMARFILSGHGDKELAMKCVGNTHQFLSKPFDAKALKTKLRRTLEMDEWLGDQKLQEIVGKLQTLPSLPSSYFQVLREVESPYAAAENIGAIITRDPAMTVKILQMVNSAFFGLSQPISNPTEAVLHLGMETVRSLVLGIQIFSQFEQLRAVQFPLKAMMMHSLKTASTARRIAQMENAEASVAEDAFTAGLLMDIGTLVIVLNLASDFETAREIGREKMKPLWDAEREVLGVSHAEVGAYLLALWGLPVAIAEAVLHHHFPGRCPNKNFSALTCVHAANVLEHEHRIDEPPFNVPEIDQAYLDEVGATDRLKEWRQAVCEARQNRTAR